VLAFAPLIGVFLEGFVSAACNIEIVNLWWITLVLNIVLCVVDESRIKKAGIDTKPFGSVFLIPVYIYKRCEQQKLGQAPLVIWSVLFALTIVGHN